MGGGHAIKARQGNNPPKFNKGKDTNNLCLGREDYKDRKKKILKKRTAKEKKRRFCRHRMILKDNIILFFGKSR